jgi:polysaccharide pyruvyl transferase WcaK-like protein
VDLQKATQACVLLLPFQPQTDRAIAQHLQAHLPGPAYVLELSDPQELKGVFQGVEMAISMRLHGLIMAAAEGCRCFALSYDPKISQLMQELNLPGWELDQLPASTTTLSSQWLNYYANGEALSELQIQSLRDRALLHRELLLQALQLET